MGSAGEDDWREEMFQKIKSLKVAYFSELMELDQTVVVRNITEEHLYSLPREKADSYKNLVKFKNTTRAMLNFLQLQKSNIPDG